MPELLTELDVSRETLEKLQEFAALVTTWNPRINLVSKNDLNDLWHRHIQDSVQIAEVTDHPGSWIDIGSGGGFPGIVVATLVQATTDQDIVFVDSDLRKCAFLKTALRQLDLTGTVLSQRVENIDIAVKQTISARAMAPLNALLVHTDRLIGLEGTAIFPKGKNWATEVKEAQREWSFDLDVIDSKTNPEAAILKLRHIQRHDQPIG